MNTIYPECQTQTSCQDHFHEMSAWELEYSIYEVHHLMVLSYHFQHPSLGLCSSNDQRPTNLSAESRGQCGNAG